MLIAANTPITTMTMSSSTIVNPVFFARTISPSFFGAVPERQNENVRKNTKLAARRTPFGVAPHTFLHVTVQSKT